MILQHLYKMFLFVTVIILLAFIIVKLISCNQLISGYNIVVFEDVRRNLCAQDIVFFMSILLVNLLLNIIIITSF